MKQKTLRALRAIANLTMKAVAEELDFTESALSLLERGKTSKLDVRRALKLSKLYGVPVEHIHRALEETVSRASEEEAA